MTLGSGITLAAVGAILYFAVDWTLAGIDIDMIGIILMIAGLAAIVFWFAAGRRRTTYRRTATPVERETVIERRDPDVY